MQRDESEGKIKELADENETLKKGDNSGSVKRIAGLKGELKEKVEGLEMYEKWYDEEREKINNQDKILFDEIGAESTNSKDENQRFV